MVEQLMDQGADVIEFPKWKISKGSLNAKVQNKLAVYKRILFTTTEAVTHFFNLLKKHKIDIRELQAKIYCLKPASIIDLERKGLMASLTDNMDVEDSLLIIGAKLKGEQHLKLDDKYGEHDYADVYELSIDERFDMAIKRSIEDASITSFFFRQVILFICL